MGLALLISFLLYEILTKEALVYSEAPCGTRLSFPLGGNVCNKPLDSSLLRAHGAERLAQPGRQFSGNGLNKSLDFGLRRNDEMAVATP